jgi:hypothetical protein
MQSRARPRRRQGIHPCCTLLFSGGRLSAVLVASLIGCGGGATGPDTSSNVPQPTPGVSAPGSLPPTEEAPQLDTGAAVYLRLRNASRVSFDTILVRVARTIDFGALPAGAESEYLPADGIYSYAYVEGTTGETRFIAQPDDYIGEQMLSPGYYTYSLSAGLSPETRNAGWVGILLSKDPPP